jgi:RNA-directed DNA polymerase
MLPHTHRGHALTGRITLETLPQAVKAVKRHRGAAGLDKQSSKRCAAHREEHRWARRRARKSGTSQPIPLRRVYLPTGKGALRPVGIPAVRGRGAQDVIRALIAPIFEPPLHDRSHGCRRHRSCPTAMGPRVEVPQQGDRGVGEADRSGCFDSMPHQRILDLVAREMADGNILSLIPKCLQAGVRAEGEGRPPCKGPPQGGVVSPLGANLVLHHLDWRWEARGYRFVRDADDVVVLGKTTRQAAKALQAGTACGEEDLGVALHPEKPG